MIIIGEREFLLGTGEAEEVVGLLLEGRRPRGESKRLSGGDGGNEGVSSERGEIVEEGSEAVDRKAVVGPAGGLLGDGGGGRCKVISGESSA